MKIAPLEPGKLPEVTCGDCGAPMRLVKPGTRNGEATWKGRTFWGCTRYPACRGKHGAHQGSNLPLGTPANEATRQARMKAHAAFDQLWKQDGLMTRAAAYRWLTEAVGATEQVHIGGASAELCEQIERVSRAKLVELQRERDAVRIRRKKEQKYAASRKASLAQRKRTAERLDRKHERRHYSEPPKQRQEGETTE